MAERVKRRVLTIAELEQVNHATANNARHLAHEVAKLATLATDAYAMRRRAEQTCAACHYLRRYRLAGQAFTNWSCSVCEEPQPAHHNTGVPRVCLGCAKTYGLCVSCGGDIETEHRRRQTGRRPRAAR